MKDANSAKASEDKFKPILKKINESQYKEAINDLTQIIENDSEKKTAYFLRGFCYLNTADLKNSLADSNKAIDLGCNDPMVYNNRGWIKFCLGMMDDAKSDYDRCLELSSETAFAEEILSINKGIYFNLGLWAYFSEQPSVALRYFDKSIDAFHENYPEWMSALPYSLRAILSSKGCDSETALAYFPKTEETNFWTCVYNGIAKIALKRYDGAILDLNEAIALNSDMGWIYYFRAQAKYFINSYQEAFADYLMALKKSSAFFLIVISSLKETITTAIDSHQEHEVINFRDSVNNQTLLHFAASRGYSGIVKLLMNLKQNGKNNIDYILARDSQGQTALMLAVANRLVDLIPLLTAPLVIERMETPLLTASNTPLLQAITQANIPTHTIVDTSQLALQDTKDVAHAYLKNGLKDENALPVQKAFENKTFEGTMQRYQKDISTCGDSDKKQALCDEVSQLALSKLKYDSEYPDKSLAKASVTNFTTTIGLLQGILNLNIAKKLENYAPYLGEVILFLHLLKELNSSTHSMHDNLSRFVSAHTSNSKYIAFILPCFKLFIYIKQSNYGLAFREITNLYRAWAKQFPTERGKKTADRFLDLMEDFYIQNENEFDFVSKIYTFSQGFQSPAAQRAVEILGCQKIVSDSISISERHIASGSIDEAKREFRCLIFNILTKTTKIYPETPKLKDTISRVTETETLDIKSVIQQKGYEQYQSIIAAFRAVEREMNNSEFKETIMLLESFKKDFDQKNESLTLFFVFFKLFSRLLIDYGNNEDNKTLSYIGLFCLVISQLYLASNKIKNSDTVLDKTKAISHEIEGFLQEIAITFKSPTVYRLAAGTLITNIVLDIVKELMDLPEITSDKSLTIIRSSIQRGDFKLSLLLNSAPKDEVLTSIQQCLEVTNRVLLIGESVKLVYDIFTGGALNRLTKNLEKYLPGESANMVMQGVNLALQGIPIVGGAMTAVNTQAAIENLRKAFDARIDKLEQRLSMHLIKLERELSRTMVLGFREVGQGLNVIHSQLVSIETQLQELRNILLDQKELIIELTLLGEMGELTKRLKRQIVESYETGKKISENVRAHYDRLLDYLSFGTHAIEGFKTVYSPRLLDSFGILYQRISQRNDFNLDLRAMPNVDLWLELTSVLIVFLHQIEPRTLFKSSFTFTPLLELFNQAQKVLHALELLNTKQVAEGFFKDVLTENVDLQRLCALVSYCSLVGISLSGYGEKPEYWTDKSATGLAWRQSILTNISENFASLCTNNLLDDAIEATYPIVYRLGEMIIALLREYTLYSENREECIYYDKFERELSDALTHLLSSHQTLNRLSNTSSLLSSSRNTHLLEHSSMFQNRRNNQDRVYAADQIQENSKEEESEFRSFDNR